MLWMIVPMRRRPGSTALRGLDVRVSVRRPVQAGGTRKRREDRAYGRLEITEKRIRLARRAAAAGSGAGHPGRADIAFGFGDRLHLDFP